MVRYVKHTNNHIQAQGTVLQTIYIEATIILFKLLTNRWRSPETSQVAYHNVPIIQRFISQSNRTANSSCLSHSDKG